MLLSPVPAPAGLWEFGRRDGFPFSQLDAEELGGDRQGHPGASIQGCCRAADYPGTQNRTEEHQICLTLAEPLFLNTKG